jgi:DNA-binding NarL/FixJ family response regulator
MALAAFWVLQATQQTSGKTKDAGGERVIHIIVADDHELTRDGLVLLLRDEFPLAEICEATTFGELLDQMVAGQPCHLILVDLHMPGIAGAADISALCDGFADARVVVVSADERREEVLGALAAGACGYVFKSSPADEIRSALHRIATGGIYIPPSMDFRQKNPSAIGARPQSLPCRALTARQQLVFSELTKGKSSKEIARVLGIAEGTVKIHLAAIYRSLGVRTRAEAIAKFG